MRLLRTLLLTLAVVAVARAALLTSYRVSGSSMLQTLGDGDRILVCELPAVVQPPRPGDTVILKLHDETLVKRVAAGPGDRIAARDGLVLRNGGRLDERIPPELRDTTSFPEYHLGPDEYFVLGDNRRASVDSRDFGPVGSAQITGRVLLRLHGGGMSTVAALER